MSSVSAINTQTLDPNALREVMNRNGATSSQKIDQAGTQFEAIFVRQFLNDALKPLVKGSIDEDGAANSTYRYFITDTLSQSLASQGIFGLGKQIATQLKGNAAHAAQGTTAGQGTEATTAAVAGTTTSAQNLIKAKATEGA